MKILERLEFLVAKTNRAMLKGGGFLAMVLAGVMTIIILLSVFWRYVLQNSIFWSEELSKMLMVWMTFMAAPVALQRGIHIGIQSLLNATKGRVHYILLVTAQLIIIVLMAVCVKEGFELAWFARRQKASSFELSMIWPYLSMPIGSFMIFSVSMENLLKALKGLIQPGTDD
ncbi:MAG: TRAP transporter small permease [Deltaproteobacteria bacterium]|nr:TRAP transporter small permease [Deltaproteobacteria bacterium]MBW1961447.1 TRAP transporter small permease [Deltaproteobacteria bacterium]MBW2151611.1 TRAP transporter small permease [Deltaproteobacteria bacterium]